MKKQSNSNEGLSAQSLEEASFVLAQLIKYYGDIYIPIFIRVLDEIENQKKQLSYREIALQLIHDKQ